MFGLNRRNVDRRDIIDATFRGNMARYLNHSCDVIFILYYSPIAKPKYNSSITNPKYSSTQSEIFNNFKNSLMTINSVLTQTKNSHAHVELKTVKVDSIDHHKQNK